MQRIFILSNKFANFYILIRRFKKILPDPRFKDFMLSRLVQLVQNLDPDKACIPILMKTLKKIGKGQCPHYISVRLSEVTGLDFFVCESFYNIAKKASETKLCIPEHYYYFVEEIPLPTEDIRTILQVGKMKKKHLRLLFWLCQDFKDMIKNNDCTRLEWLQISEEVFLF